MTRAVSIACSIGYRTAGRSPLAGSGDFTMIDCYSALRSGLDEPMPLWTWLIPVLSVVLLVAALVAGVGALLAGLCAVALMGTVIAAVHHAEVVAHRVGEPFGTLVLALAVTVIEAALVLSMMIAGGSETAVLARDAIYAAVMIICTGVVGICLLVGGLAHREQTFRVEGAGAGLAALMVMSALTLVLPVFTTSTPGFGTYSTSQLAFVAVTSAALWAIFIFIQTVRHRDYFIPVTDAANPDVHAEPPTIRETWMSFGLLLVSLVVIVGLAKMLSPTIERAVEAANAPRVVIGIVIASLVLLPEAWAAVRAAQANRLQSGLGPKRSTAYSGADRGKLARRSRRAGARLDPERIRGHQPQPVMASGWPSAVSRSRPDVR